MYERPAEPVKWGTPLLVGEMESLLKSGVQRWFKQLRYYVLACFMLSFVITYIWIFQPNFYSLLIFDELRPANHSLVLIWDENVFGMPSTTFLGKKALRSCPQQKCFISNRNHLAHESDAILFFWDHAKSWAEIPVQLNKQLLVFIDLESPARDSWLNASEITRKYAKYNNFFNLTVTYRKDSDIYIPYKYVDLNRMDETRGKNISLLQSKIERKTKMAVWFVSNHYSVWSERDRIVKELIGHGISVDIYGEDAKRTCPLSQEEKCMKMVDEEYKFYFAFENSNCKDYITEKFYKILELDTVPVVLGGGNYKSIVPKEAFIDFADFASTKDLAQYLKMLNKNNTMYLKHLKWKLKYNLNIRSGTDNLFCRLCEFLTTKSSFNSSQSVQNLKKWWYDGKCLFDKRQFNRTAIDEVYNYS